jgi:hypothetical protein
MAVAVTGVNHGGQEVSTVYALFANLSISVENRSRAKESVVMERMYDRNTFLCGRVKHRWGDYWKSVVHVNDIWPSSLNKVTQFTKARLIPHHLAKYRKSIVDICVGCFVQKNLVSTGSK